MKTFTIHSARNVSAFFIALGLGYMAYTVSPNSVEIPKAEAGASDNVSGFAWSENIGWISFNNTSDGSVTSYGVKVNTDNGDFSGNAWSENVGWISFDRANIGNPPGAPFNGGSGPVAQVNLATGNVTGWARVLSQMSEGDGWIKLSDSTWTNGVKISPSDGKFSGYAWSSDSVGWISFNCSTDGSCGSSNYFVQGPELNCTNLANNPPTCTQCPDGQFYNTISSQCYSCSGTGCNGTGGTTSPGNEFGSLSCNGGTTNVPGCNACPQLEVLVGNSCENSIGNGTCDIDAGENLTNSPVDCKPKTRFWQF